MRAATSSVDDLFEPDRVLRAPLFQRRYVWEEQAHLAPFWADLRRRAADRIVGAPAPFAHFLGAILLQADAADGGRRIIDGQQRLITLYLTMAALRRAAAARELDAMTARLHRRLQLMSGGRKLVATAVDDAFLDEIAESGAPVALARRWPCRFAKGRARLLKSGVTPDCLSAYMALLERVERFVEGGDADPATEPETAAAAPARRLEAMADALLLDFRAVAIELDGDDDGPGIFEALNDRGAPLTAADLVRNDVVRRARVGGEDAAYLLDRYWRPLADQPFWRASVKVGRAKAQQLDNLLRHYLIAVGAPATTPRRVFHGYRAFVAARPTPFPTIEAEMARLATAAAAYRALLAPEEGGDPDDPLNRALRQTGARIRAWAPSAAIGPLLATALAEGASAEERAGTLDIVVGYLVRRDVCGLNRRNLHRAGAALARQLADQGGAGLAAAAIEHLALQVGADAQWPNDPQFERHWRTTPIAARGGHGRALSLLIALEADASGRPESDIEAERPHVDHIMPRDWSDAERKRWPDPPIGPGVALDDAFRRRQTAIEAIGNLALVEPSLNAKLSNAGFDDRRAHYRRSRYVTTQALAEVDDWDERAMDARAKAWAPLAFRLWPGPNASV